MSKILIVDDERVNRKVFAMVLQQAGYEVLEAADGCDALEYFDSHHSDLAKPDLVLLDVMMPILGGYETCRRIREIDRETPIIFLTALGSLADEELGLKVGADDYLDKTVSEGKLLARVSAALARAERLSKVAAPPTLTKLQADIYRVLSSELGRFFSYGEIFTAICGEGYTHNEGVIRSHMSRLRRRLPAGLDIVSKRGRGYALIRK